MDTQPVTLAAGRARLLEEMSNPRGSPRVVGTADHFKPLFAIDGSTELPVVNTGTSSTIVVRAPVARTTASVACAA